MRGLGEGVSRRPGVGASAAAGSPPAAAGSGLVGHWARRDGRATKRKSPLAGRASSSVAIAATGLWRGLVACARHRRLDLGAVGLGDNGAERTARCFNRRRDQATLWSQLIRGVGRRRRGQRRAAHDGRPGRGLDLGAAGGCRTGAERIIRSFYGGRDRLRRPGNRLRHAGQGRRVQRRAAHGGWPGRGLDPALSAEACRSRTEDPGFHCGRHRLRVSATGSVHAVMATGAAASGARQPGRARAPPSVGAVRGSVSATARLCASARTEASPGRPCCRPGASADSAARAPQEPRDHAGPGGILLRLGRLDHRCAVRTRLHRSAREGVH